MYFRNRAEAGRMLARKLEEYGKKPVVVLALSPGAAIVGAQIAIKVHAQLAMLLTENLYLPGEIDPIAAMASTGTFTYNESFSPGQLEEYVSEYHHFIEEKRIEQIHNLNKMMGKDGEIKKEYLRNHVVIVVSDGMSNGFSLDIAAAYLKTIAVKKIVVAVPVASVQAVDRMHLFADEICCLSVAGNYMNTNHYYDDNTIPSTDRILDLIRNTPLNWERPRASQKAIAKA